MSNPQPLTKEDFIEILDDRLERRFAIYDKSNKVYLDDRFAKYDASLDKKLDDKFEEADARTERRLQAFKNEIIHRNDVLWEEMRDEFRAVIDQNKSIIRKLDTKADKSEVEELRQDVRILERQVVK